MDSVASSSFPAASSSRHTYDVFLSFRGTDTRHNFTHNLYNELVRRGIHTFKDDDELPKGKEIARQLPKAIHESRIAIVVLSANYGNSRWCLDELVEIVECMDTRGQLVLPVFCGVDPSHVRKQSGSFEGAFVEHEVRYAGKVEKWRSALTKVGSLSGWDLQSFANRNEAQVINEIVEVVARRVKHTFLHVAKYLVRLDYHEHALYSLLGTRGQGGVTFVGIFGMGGIGKTTIAKHFYNSAFVRYEGSWFLANVREGSGQPNGMVQLQKELLSQLMMKNVREVPNLDRGISLLDQRLRNRRVLIVLDDVDTREQLNSLAGDRSSFGEGSLVIVTTRNEQLLDQVRVDFKYEVGVLDEVGSLELFSWHAFHNPVPPPTFLNISKEFVKHAGGLPLALEVLGSSLVDENHAYWESMMNKLKVIPHHEIQEKLKISFDALNDYTQKEIFLDIACFFVGMEKTQAVMIFDGCGFFGEAGITTLVRRSLLKICPFSNKLEMHDLVRDMGRGIVFGSSPKMHGKQSRVWQQDDVLDVLRNDKGTAKIEGMVLELSMQEHFSTRPFAKMPNLRLLKLKNVDLIGDFEGFSKELRWLSWHGCPLESLPTNLHLEKLVYLDMVESNLRFLWNGKKLLGNLKIMDFRDSKLLTTTPIFSEVRNLEELRLDRCLNLSNIDPSIGLLDKLRTLNLECCKNLKHLPEQLGAIKSLTTLNASSSAIEELPASIGHLDKLDILRLEGCCNLKRLPEKLGAMKSLTTLVASASGIEELPTSIGRLDKLVVLHLEGCSNLKRLPKQLGAMKGLTTLMAHGSGIEELPDSIGLLDKLIILNLRGCHNLKRLPSTIGLLKSLETLDVSECSNLEGLPEALGDIKCLKYIDASGSGIKELLESVGNLCQLETLSLYGCQSLKILPNSIGNMASLSQLCLWDCSNLEQLPDNLQGLSSLWELNLSGTNISGLQPSIAQLSGLGSLSLNNCRSLQFLSHLPPNLKILYANDCPSLEKLPDLSNFSLEFIELANCYRLVEIQGLENLNIDLEGCSDIVSTTALQKFLLQGHNGRSSLYELYLPRRAIPDCFEHRGMGESVISFDMPIYVPDASSRITIWLEFGTVSNDVPWPEIVLLLYVENKTRGVKRDFPVWRHYKAGAGGGSWVIHVPLYDGVKGGDSIEVSFGADEFGDIRWTLGKWGVYLGHYTSEKDNLLNLTLSYTKDRDLKRCLDVEGVETSSNKRSLQFTQTSISLGSLDLNSSMFGAWEVEPSNNDNSNQLMDIEEPLDLDPSLWRLGR